MQSVKVVVVGSGVVGLSTAVCLAENLPHCSVTVISERFSPDTTSDGAAGILFASQFPGSKSLTDHVIIFCATLPNSCGLVVNFYVY